MIRRIYSWLLASFRLSDSAVCEMSKGLSPHADFPDDIDGYPDHFCTLTCKRCGKHFTI